MKESKKLKKIMIEKFMLEKLKYDFMGYDFCYNNELSYHHLIIPKRECSDLIYKGYYIWNGAILKQNTSHNYLHVIERYDLDAFLAITSEMIDENFKGKLDKENILKIHSILRSFEKEYEGKTDETGKLIIKPEYTRTRTLMLP